MLSADNVANYICKMFIMYIFLTVLAMKLNERYNCLEMYLVQRKQEIYTHDREIFLLSGH